MEMEEQSLRKTAWLFCAILIFALPATADILYSNLGPSGNVYNCCTGWTVTGTGSIGTSFIAANEFQVAASGAVNSIDIAVGYVEGANAFYVGIYADNGGIPGTQLGYWGNLSSNTNFGSCCGLVTISGISGLNLSTGVNYWMVVGPMTTGSDTWEAWNFSNSALGNDDYSTDGGKSWVQQGQQPLGAFDIVGGSTTGSTPEPSSLLLFGAGVVATFGAIRRKMNL